MISRSRMVLATPGPLLTPPPSSSPPKTPGLVKSVIAIAFGIVGRQSTWHSDDDVFFLFYLHHAPVRTYAVTAVSPSVSGCSTDLVIPRIGGVGPTLLSVETQTASIP
jgi:hypothetical protein